MHLAESAIPEALDEVHRLLKPGGAFLLSVPIERPNLDPDSRDNAGPLFTMLPPEDVLQLTLYGRDFEGGIDFTLEASGRHAGRC